MALRNYLVGEVAEDFVDGLLSRREALRRLTLLGPSVSRHATALLAACGEPTGGGSGAPSPAADTPAPAPVTTTPGRTATTKAGKRCASRVRPVSCRAWAAAEDPQGALLVIHENRGLTPHFVDLVGRYAAPRTQRCAWTCSQPKVAPVTGRSSGRTDHAGEHPARAAFGCGSPIGIDEPERRVSGEGGAVGFCFGGGMTWNLLQVGEQRLAAAVPFTDPHPRALISARPKQPSRRLR